MDDSSRDLYGCERLESSDLSKYGWRHLYFRKIKIKINDRNETRTADGSVSVRFNLGYPLCCYANKNRVFFVGSVRSVSAPRRTCFNCILFADELFKRQRTILYYRPDPLDPRDRVTLHWALIVINRSVRIIIFPTSFSGHPIVIIIVWRLIYFSPRGRRKFKSSKLCPADH